MSKFKKYERYKDSGVEWLGEIPEHWGVKPLKRVFKIINGGTPSSSEESYWNGEIAWVTPNDLSKLTEACIVDSERKITQDGLHNCSARIVPKGSIVISTRAPIGYVAIAGVPLCTNQGCKSLVAIKKVNPKYFYYWMHSISFYLNVLGQGTTFIELSNSSLSMVELLTPSINEQKAIANFLDQKTAEIDDLIADKEKLIQLLQEKRQAIITEAVTKGLNPNVRMKDSGIEWIGEIPEHWRIVRLKFLKASPLQYGANEPAEMDDPQMPRYIRITDINEKGDLKEDTFKSLSWENAQPYLLKDGDILFARSGATVGKTFIYKEELGPACYAGYLIRFRPDKNKANPYYIYYYTLSKVYEDWIKQNIIQATIQNVSAEKYGNLQIPVPPMEEQKRIVKYLNNKIQGIDILVESIHVQIQKLKEYRQSLISEAVTGKIDVRDWMLTIKLE